MTERGVHMALQRLFSLIAGIAFVATLGALPLLGSVGLLALSLGLYMFWPVPPAETGALLYRRGPAVVGPDLMGLVLVSGFIGLPLIASRIEGGLHPSSVLVWPVGAVFVALLVVGWRRGVFALSVDETGIAADTGWMHRQMRFDQIEAIEPWRRDLVRQMRPLAPLLVAAGQPGAAGALLVSRESRGIAIVGRDGSYWPIPGDAFEEGLEVLLTACEAHGVAFRIPGYGQTGEAASEG